MSLKLQDNGKQWPVVAMFLILLNLFTTVQLEATTGTPENQDLSDSGFSWDIATDNPALYNILPMLDIESLIKELTKTNSRRDQKTLPETRRKRSLFTSNYRKRIYRIVGSVEAENKPFSAAVRISNKCSGTLIGDRHVLTAAHCVHNGKRWKYKLPLLKVGFLQKSGKFHWIKVTKMFVPDTWKKIKAKDTRKALDADFAVLRLKRPHGRHYFIPRRGSYYLKSPMMFNGFPGDKGGKIMWHSSCRVRKVLGDILVSICSASEGSSGSGIYMSRGQGYAVSGIVSAALEVRNKKHRILLTIATRLTPGKVKLICHWMGPEAKSGCKW